ADLPEEQRNAHLRGALASKDKDDRERGLDNASVPGGVPNTLPPAPAAGGGGATGGHAQNGWAQNAPPPAAAPAPAQQAPNDPQGRAQLEKKAELSPFDTALQTYRAGRFDDATRAFDTLAPGDANADLWAARSIRESKGCRNAVARFDK